MALEEQNRTSVIVENREEKEQQSVENNVGSNSSSPNASTDSKVDTSEVKAEEEIDVKEEVMDSASEDSAEDAPADSLHNLFKCAARVAESAKLKAMLNLRVKLMKLARQKVTRQACAISSGYSRIGTEFDIEVSPAESPGSATKLLSPLQYLRERPLCG